MMTSELSSVSVKDCELQASIIVWTWQPNDPQFGGFLRRSDRKSTAYWWRRVCGSNVRIEEETQRRLVWIIF